MNPLADVDIHAQVRAGDIDLGTLTDDEFRALWAREEVDLDPARQPVMDAALRSLVARGLAEVDDQDRVVLGGIATFVRTARMQNLGTARFRLPAGRPHHQLVWFLVQPDCLLELAWRAPGLCDLRLRRTGRAVRELVADLVPDDEPGDGGAGDAGADAEAWTWVEDDPASTERLEALAAERPDITLVEVVRPVTGAQADGWLTINAMVATGPEVGPRLVLSEVPGRSSVEAVTRSRLRKLLLATTEGEALAAVPVVPAVPGR